MMKNKRAKMKVLLMPMCCSLTQDFILALNEPYEITIFYDNPNFSWKCAKDLSRDYYYNLAQKNNLSFIDWSERFYVWDARAGILEQTEDAGVACELCFLSRIDRACQYAQRSDYEIIACPFEINKNEDTTKIRKKLFQAMVETHGLKPLILQVFDHQIK